MKWKSNPLILDTLKLDTNKIIGAYYLQKGKGNERDRPVFWHYGYLESGKLAFNYSVFSYEPDGKTIYGDRGGKTFDVSYDAAIASGHQVFLVMIKKLTIISKLLIVAMIVICYWTIKVIVL